MNKHLSRRAFFKTSSMDLVDLVASLQPGLFLGTASAAGPVKSPNERLRFGTIGLRYQGSVITHIAQKYGDIVALCDVDWFVREQARASFGSTPKIFEDYRDLLKMKDLDAGLINKDVYCEKPMTLTLDEGKLIERVVSKTKRVVQIGS